MTKNTTKKFNSNKKASLKKKTASFQNKRKLVQKVKSAKYQDYLIKSLEDPKEAVSYLNAALEDGEIKVFLIALQNVIQANGGMKRLSEKVHKGRTSLYKSLSEKGNPYLKSTTELLDALDMHLAIVPSHSKTKIAQTEPSSRGISQ